MASAPYYSDDEVKADIGDDWTAAREAIPSYSRTIRIAELTPDNADGIAPGILHSFAEIAEQLGLPIKAEGNSYVIKRPINAEEIDNLAVVHHRWEMQHKWREEHKEDDK